MRTVDERVTAVRSRTVRLHRRRSNWALSALVCLMALPLVVLTGGYATSAFELPRAQGGSLFGATSLLGSSAGGYVLVAVVSFALAVLVTAFIMLRRRRQDEREEASPDSAVACEPDDAPSKTAR